MPDVPSWISVTHGTAPLLLLAPHGGRRDAVRVPGKHKVNDLLTGDVTRALAAATGASTIVNEHVDRNLLDLNRLSQVRRDAPWLVVLLAELLEAMLVRDGYATVLVVHGWNTTQAACDVGIGLHETESGLASVRPGASTTSTAFVAVRLRPLQAAAEAAGIAVTIGSRYPAAHPNNLLEIFRMATRAGDEGSCPIAALRQSGTIEAAQLELAIPLRWPGPRRDRFVALLAETFGEVPRSPSRARPVAARLWATGGRVTHRRGVQFLMGDILVMASIDAGEAGPIAGRLVISLDAERLALFTGELCDSGTAWRIPPLGVESEPDGAMRVVYAGPLVAFPSHTPFLDLERGLAGGRLVEGELDVTFRPHPNRVIDGSEGTFGEVNGTLVMDGRRVRVATRGVSMQGGVPGARRLPSCRLTLPDSPWGTVALATDPDAPLTSADAHWIGRLHGTLWNGEGRVAESAEGTLRLGDDANELALTRVSDGSPLRADLERLIPVRRPGREGTVVETTFALVRVSGTCVGWVEVSMTCPADRLG